MSSQTILRVKRKVFHGDSSVESEDALPFVIVRSRHATKRAKHGVNSVAALLGNMSIETQDGSKDEEFKEEKKCLFRMVGRVREDEESQLEKVLHDMVTKSHPRNIRGIDAVSRDTERISKEVLSKSIRSGREEYRFKEIARRRSRAKDNNLHGAIKENIPNVSLDSYNIIDFEAFCPDESELKEEQYVYDLYVLEKAVELSSKKLTQQVNLSSQESDSNFYQYPELVLNNVIEDDNDWLFTPGTGEFRDDEDLLSDEEDENAEDFYRNDYPDEEELSEEGDDIDFYGHSHINYRDVENYDDSIDPLEGDYY